MDDKKFSKKFPTDEKKKINVDLLNNIYNNPLSGFQSADKLYRKAKEHDKKITKEDVVEFLKENQTSQITQQVKKPKNYETIVSPSVRNNYQIDVMYLPDFKRNKNFRYLVTCIDVYSRFAFVKPIHFKNGDLVFHAFKVMMEEYGKPKNINVDKGSEFVYKPFVKYCEDNDITLWYSNPEQDNKNAIIERFHRTLRNLLLKYNVATGKPYIDVLQDLVKNYNSTFHKTINAEPINVWTDKKKPKQKHSLIVNEFKVGDRVRHIISKQGFDKNSSTHTYSKKIYTITRVDKHSYYLDDLTKPFREYQLVEAIGQSIETKYDKKVEDDNLKERIKRKLKKEGLL